MKENTRYIPKIGTDGEVIYSKIYYRRGVQVDVIKPRRTVMLANESGIFSDTLVAIKRNVPGFWDRQLQDFVPEPRFLEDPNQEHYHRHTPEVMEQEKAVMKFLLGRRLIAKYVPLLFDTDSETVATEFIQGNLLEHEIEQGTLSLRERLEVIRQLMEYVYLIHQAGVNHNDYHGRNIVVTPNRRIKVIDYSMAGDPDATLPTGWDDLSRVNQYIVRTLTLNIEEKVRSLSEAELASTGPYATLLAKLPFTQSNFYSLYQHNL